MNVAKDTDHTAVRCPGCRSEERSPKVLLRGHDRLTGAPGRFTVVSCGNCGLAFTQPRLSDQDFETYYPETYSSYAPPVLRGPRFVAERVRVDWAIRFGPYREIWHHGPCRVLDVGCGTGILAAGFRRHGFDVVGLDLSETAISYARSRGLDVCAGTLDDSPWPDASFDAVTFSHSLEHIEDPANAVARAARLLRPGGLLVIVVPNFGSWHRRVFGSAWFQLDLPRHLQHFDRDTLSKLVRRAGCHPQQVGSGSMAWSLVASAQYAAFGRVRFGGRGFHLAAWAILPLVALFDRIGEGDVLHMVAERGPHL